MLEDADAAGALMGARLGLTERAAVLPKLYGIRITDTSDSDGLASELGELVVNAR